MLKKFTISLLAALTVNLVGCGANDMQGAAVPEATPSQSGMLAAQMFSDGSVTTTPAVYSGVLANPFHGFVTMASTFYAQPTIPQTLVYADVTWHDLEPARGNLNWDVLEQDWQQHTDLGRKVGFRFKMTDPWSGVNNDLPDWLIALGVAMRPYTIDGGSGRAPDWNNDILLQEHERVIAAFGQRYNNDPRIAWVDIGSYGIWGEWHVAVDGGGANLEATAASKKRILDAYLKAFPNKRLVIAFDDPYATQYVTANQQGVRNDCLGTKASNNWYLTAMNAINPALNDSIYKSAIVTGEFCGGDQGAVKGVTTNFATNLSFVKKTHWSWIGPAGGNLLMPANATVRANAETLHKTIGYRFRVASVTHAATALRGSALALQATIQNDGVAPFYYPWPVELSLLDAAGVPVLKTQVAWDIQTWLPGATAVSASIALPMNLVAGNYTLAIAVLDPATNAPGVALAQTGKAADGRYPLSTVTVN